MIYSSVYLLRFIVWSFLKASILFVLDQFNGATSRPDREHAGRLQLAGEERHARWREVVKRANVPMN